MENVKVSVIVPVYNVETYLEEALMSLKNQTLKEIEFLIINDGSTDNSQKIIEEIASVMTTLANEKERIENDKKIIENYTKAVGLEPYSWVGLIDSGRTASELIKEIDSAFALKKEQEEREKAKKEHDDAIAALKTETINNKTVDTETGEIITEEVPKTSRNNKRKQLR